jgi:hypothetical protein
VCISSVYICFGGWCIFNHMVNVHASAFLVVLWDFCLFFASIFLDFFRLYFSPEYLLLFFIVILFVYTVLLIIFLSLFVEFYTIYCL